MHDTCVRTGRGETMVSQQPVPARNALQYSTDIQAAASAKGFDWPDWFGVLEKLDEELGEVREALLHKDQAHAVRELGDLLLAAVNLARFLKCDPAAALVDATNRFSIRFAALEQALETAGLRMDQCSLEELEAVWQRIKTGADATAE
jgi:ATP diphosphatase